MSVLDDSNTHRGIDFVGISVPSLLHDGNGRFLLQKRGPKARDERGRWDFCAGAMEFGQTIEETIRRELKEELGVEPLEIVFLKTGEAHRESPGGKPTHWVWLFHAVKINPARVTICEPHKIAEVGWFTSETLPSPLHSQFWKSFESALDAGIVK